MLTRTLTYGTAAALMVALVAGTRGAAQAPQPQPAGPRPALFVSATSVSADGRRGGVAGSEHAFVPGRETTQTLFAGNLATGTTCAAGTSAPAAPTGDRLASHPHVWQITTSPTRYEQGRLFFDLDWARYAAIGGTTPVASKHAALSLDEGERLVLDLVHARPDDEDCRSVVVEVEARVHEDRALADLLIRYDAWLVHTDPAGRTGSQWIVTTARHGVDVPFSLAVQRLAVPRLSADQFEFDVTTRVDGRLRGRLNADGTLAVDLLAERLDALERRDGAGRAGTPGGRGQGRRQLRMRPGEAVRIELPAPTGAMMQTATPGAPGVSGMGAWQLGLPAAPGAPVSLRDGQLTVRMPAFFEGHTVALLLRATLVGQ